MNIEVSGRDKALSEKVKAYAVQKAGKLSRYYDRLTSAKVVLAEKEGNHKAEIVVAAAGGKTLVGETSGSETYYAAIDTVMEKMEKQVKKHKEMLIQRNRKGQA